VAESIRAKAPSADLWEGQSDEEELGATYEELDRLLVRLVDDREPPSRLVEAGFADDFVRSVERRIRANQYKRRPPILAKIGTRTIGPDFRLPRDAGGATDRRPLRTEKSERSGESP
jgi:NAD+ synthase